MLFNASDVVANVTSLQPFTVYELTVAAATTQGYGPESRPLRQRTQEDGEIHTHCFLFNDRLLQLTMRIHFLVSRCRVVL